jgi:hypothetical protein
MYSKTARSIDRLLGDESVGRGFPVTSNQPGSAMRISCLREVSDGPVFGLRARPAAEGRQEGYNKPGEPGPQDPGVHNVKDVADIGLIRACRCRITLIVCVRGSKMTRSPRDREQYAPAFRQYEGLVTGRRERSTQCTPLMA